GYCGSAKARIGNHPASILASITSTRRDEPLYCPIEKGRGKRFCRRSNSKFLRYTAYGVPSTLLLSQINSAGSASGSRCKNSLSLYQSQKPLMNAPNQKALKTRNSKLLRDTKVGITHATKTTPHEK